MNRPRLLDLFSGAGGAAMGYHNAGFEVVGVDIQAYKRYPFEHHVADAIEYASTHWEEFDAIHASPPCQHGSHSTKAFRNAGKVYPNFLPQTRELLLSLPIPWVIENVPGTEIRADYDLCGCFFGLRLRRRRLFETSWHGSEMMPTHNHVGPRPFSVIGDWSTSAERKWLGRAATTQERNDAMGIDWMKGHELGLAIPPAYTEWVGERLMGEVMSSRGDAA